MTKILNRAAPAPARTVDAQQLPAAVKSLALLFVPLMLTGCGSLTGFNNAQTNFSCQGKTGEPSCRTISEVYADTDYKMRLKDALEEAKAQPFPSSASAHGAPNTIRERVSASTPAAGFTPKCAEGEARCREVSAAKSSAFTRLRRIPEKILRVWLAPFTDDKGDLHDARYVYVKVEDAKWAEGIETTLVENDRRAHSAGNRIYQRVYPLKNAADAEPDAAGEKKKREADLRRSLTELQKSANPLLNRTQPVNPGVLSRN
jgi:type IV conjugative transfer system lipoprotein TraV